jgi:hypothetical protein
MKNLSNFPTVYYINLDAREDRRNSIEQSFKDYNIKNYTRISASRFLGVSTRTVGAPNFG